MIIFLAGHQISVAQDSLASWLRFEIAYPFSPGGGFNVGTKITTGGSLSKALTLHDPNALVGRISIPQLAIVVADRIVLRGGLAFSSLRQNYSNLETSLNEVYPNFYFSNEGKWSGGKVIPNGFRYFIKQAGMGYQFKIRNLKLRSFASYYLSGKSNHDLVAFEMKPYGTNYISRMNAETLNTTSTGWDCGVQLKFADWPFKSNRFFSCSTISLLFGQMYTHGSWNFTKEDLGPAAMTTSWTEDFSLVHSFILAEVSMNLGIIAWRK